MGGPGAPLRHGYGPVFRVIELQARRRAGRLPHDRPVSLPDPSPDTAALVTGASAGIGAAIARELAQRGHNLVLVARRKDRLDALAGELNGEFGVRAETVGCDLGKAASRERLPARVGSLGLEVSVLVNNAGFATGGAFHQSDPARELEQVRVLVEAPVALTSAFLPEMVAPRQGRDPQRRLDRRHAAAALLGRLLGGQGLRAHLLRGPAPGAARLRRDRDRARPRAGDDRLLGVAGWEVAGGRRSSGRCPARPGSPPSRPPAPASRASRPGAASSSPACPIRAAMLGQPVPPPRAQAARHRAGHAPPLSGPALPLSGQPL